MTVHVALNHITRYRYDRPVGVSPQVIRLRPAPHCRTPVLSYSLQILPKEHFINWQQDPHGNFLARAVFPEKIQSFEVTVDLTAKMTVINPFDFFLEPSAEKYPVVYDAEAAVELAPFRVPVALGEPGRAFAAGIDRAEQSMIDFLVDLNLQVKSAVSYLVRMEPGVQTPEETLRFGRGSCRDSAWLMVALLRDLGFAARFASGYLIQLTADIPSLDGPSGPAEDFCDLHAWAEVFLPGAGWVGLDATSGLLTGEGHIPLACAPFPTSAAPITGSVEACETRFEHTMSVTRVREDPRVTKPYEPRDWSALLEMGTMADARLSAAKVGLTMGGEPTFVFLDDKDGEAWNTAAHGPDKKRAAYRLLLALKERWAPGGLVHLGQGKWVPGEPLPRWALSCFWRTDGEPVWRNPSLLADAEKDAGADWQTARRFIGRLAAILGVSEAHIRPGYEDPLYNSRREESTLPAEADPSTPQLDDPRERVRSTRVSAQALGTPTGFALPVAPPVSPDDGECWRSEQWAFHNDRMLLIPGDSPMGLRLPIDGLPSLSPDEMPKVSAMDPTAMQLPFSRSGNGAVDGGISVAEGTVRTALCAESRGGVLHLFLPPVGRPEAFLVLVACVERAAAAESIPVVVEGDAPPPDSRLQQLKITPDTGVVTVNMPPSSDWETLVERTEILYEAARAFRLVAERFDLDGRHTGTGGGSHMVLGGATPLESPFLRRPDLLRSFINFWHNHPSLSYLFSGRFVGPAGPAPRVDEGRRDAIYEMEIAFQRTPEGEGSPPWIADRLFRHLLTDGNGNPRCAELCIDKLYAPDTASGRRGLVAFCAFEMPPHPQMSLAEQLLLRALTVSLWENPYKAPLVRWNTRIHDRFLLPLFVKQDFDEVLAFLRDAGFPFRDRHFAPHFEFRFPLIGETDVRGLHLELREAAEPWGYVLGEAPDGGGTTRYVDASVERLQVKVSGYIPERFAVTCNGRPVPLCPTGTEGAYAAGVRYRAWRPPHCLHPTIPVDSPLVFDVVDTVAGRSLGGCTYRTVHPGGRNFETFPVNANEAEARRAARFSPMGHTPGNMGGLPEEAENREFPTTLDLRRRPVQRRSGGSFSGGEGGAT